MTYAGDITATEAWELLQQHPDAVLVDVRTEAEWKQVGVPDTASLGKQPALISWVSSQGEVNPNFIEQLKEAVPQTSEQAPVLFLCRSGQRSIAAANAATAAGIGPAYNIVQGFEGGTVHDGQREIAGWKAAGLSWTTLS